MSQQIKVILIIVGVLILCSVGAILFSRYKDNQLVKETILRTESEMRFKQLAVEAKVLKAHSDSLFFENKALEITIENQKNNPITIIRKANEIHINLDNLSAINSIVLFTNNSAKLQSGKDRYRLLRFSK